MPNHPRDCAEYVVRTYPCSAQMKEWNLSTLASCVSGTGETETQYVVHYQYRYGIGGWLVVMPKTQIDQITAMNPKQLEAIEVTCYEYMSRVRWFGLGRRYRLKRIFGKKASQAALAVGAGLVR